MEQEPLEPLDFDADIAMLKARWLEEKEEVSYSEILTDR